MTYALAAERRTTEIAEGETEATEQVQSACSRRLRTTRIGNIYVHFTIVNNTKKNEEKNLV